MTDFDFNRVESSEPVACNQRAAGSLPLRLKALLLAAVAVTWLALDMATKHIAQSFELGEVFGGPFAGLVQFRLVHNTGAAWGMFGDATFLLGVFSLVVCAALVFYLFMLAPHASAFETFSLGLVLAGGLGNAFDRFSLHYVVDFIEPVFIDFPVFNVADIGVTCGIVLFMVAFLREWRTQ